MASMKQDELKEYEASCQALQQGKRSLLLSTLSEAGLPEISYAPYWRNEQCEFCIFVSRLAAHTMNLLANPVCSVLFIEDETESRNLFARERLSYRCEVEEAHTDSVEYGSTLDSMEAHLGATIPLLRGLPDFHLFKLKPQSGSYVVGFGKAFEVDPVDNSLSHLNVDRLKG